LERIARMIEKKETKNISIDLIESSPRNKRSMETAAIQALAMNIAQNSLLSPITVYEKDGRYVILSGNRRFEALKSLGWDDIPCFIAEQPADEYDEQEIIMAGNFHRSKPDEVVAEVRAAAETWNNMPDDRRDKMKPLLKKSFIARSEAKPKYQENPEEFISHNLVYKEEYIRVMTGLDYSNITISRILKDLLPNENENTEPEEDLKFAEPEQEEVKQEKKTKVTGKKIAKELDKIIGMVETFDPDDAVINVILDEIRNELMKVRESVSTFVK